MNRYLACVAALGAGLALIGATDNDGAASQGEHKPKVEVVSVGPDGKPDLIRIDGVETKVCKGDVKDGCIDPRDAGLDFGGKEIDYWPGKPASEIEGKLPEHEANMGAKQD